MPIIKSKYVLLFSCLHFNLNTVYVWFPSSFSLQNVDILRYYTYMYVCACVCNRSSEMHLCIRTITLRMLSLRSPSPVKCVSSTLHEAKTSPVSPSWVRERRQNKEVPVSTVNLCCQSILSLTMWSDYHHKRQDFYSGSDEVTQPVESETSSDASLKCVFAVITLRFRYSDLRSIPILSMSFFLFLKKNKKKNFGLFSQWCTHAACVRGDDDAWGCECRIKNSVFQGHAFWSGISLLRSYSQQHFRSPWKGILGCTAEV